MANNMGSLDFSAPDSAPLDKTSFLNNCDPTLLPDPSLGSFRGFGEPMMDWPAVENPNWVLLGNAELSSGVTDGLTDSSMPGSHFPNPGWGVQSGPYQQHQQWKLRHRLISTNRSEQKKAFCVNLPSKVSKWKKRGLPARPIRCQQ
jgi:hypothetical protein